MLSDFLPWNWSRRASVSAGYRPSDDQIMSLFRGLTADSGVEVTHDTMTKVSAVVAANRLISTTLASLPVDVYQRREDGGKDRLHNHPVSQLLRHRVNPIQNSYQWRESKQWGAGIYGNSYSRVMRDRGAVPRELWLLKSERMEDISLREIAGRKRLVYLYREKDSEKATALLDDEVLHLAWTGPAGLAGFDPVKLGGEVFGAALATQEHAQRFFANGATPAGLLKYPGTFNSKETRKRFRDSWQEHAEMRNKHKMMILENGMDYQALSIDPRLSQLLESRNFSVTDVARFYGVPPHLIADLERSTNNNIEQQSLEFVTYCLLPWTTRWEAVLETALLAQAELDAGLFIEFNLMGLLRGDSIARSQYYSTMRNIGAMNSDEIRSFENLNPIPDGKGATYWQPVNMMELGAELPSTDTGDEEEEPEEEPPEDEPEEGSRELRSARAKQRISASFRPVMRELFGRVVKRERQDVEAQLKKRLQQRGTDDFRVWLQEYYQRDMAEWLTPMVAPAYSAVDEAVRRDIAEELGQKLLPAHSRALQRYTSALAKQYSRASLGQLTALLASATAADEIAQRLVEWGEKKAAKWAGREAVSATGAFTVETYRGHGIQRLRWMAIGKTCPYCERMDGRVVSTGEPFLRKGDTLTADGKPTIRIRKKVTHPAAHAGCDCALVPG